jgi:hypothetical protein
MVQSGNVHSAAPLTSVRVNDSLQYIRPPVVVERRDVPSNVVTPASPESVLHDALLCPP